MIRPAGPTRTYQELVIIGLTRHPEREALVEGALRLDGRQLSRRVAQHAQAYLDLGLEPGSRIALLGANSTEYLLAQLAAAALGISFTGLHPLSSPDEIAQVLRTLTPDAVVLDPRSSLDTAERARQLLDGSPIQFWSMGPAGLDVDLAALAENTDPVDLLDVHRVDVTDIASISFTGGTTGLPKGVVRSQRSNACALTTMLSEWDWPSELRFLAIAPLTHATGSMLPAVLLNGGTIHLRATFEPDAVAAHIRAEQITSTFMVPTMIYRMLERPEQADADLASLQHLIYGAAAISADRLDAGLRRWGKIFMQLYGQVEAPNTVSTLRIADHVAGDLDRLSSCGRSAIAVDVGLFTDDGTAVPDGDTGEICVRGPLVMDGYLDDPAATAEAFRDSWLRTGDMATRDADGFLRIVDRRKDMIVSGGFNIFAGDVEQALNAHPAVAECAVIGIPDDTWGEAVTAYVVLCQDVPDEVLTAHVRDLKGRAWSPKHVHVVDALPLTTLGKPDKKALRRRHWPAAGRAVH